MLLIGTRVNTLTHLNVTNTFITENECSFTFDEVLKHSRPNYCRKPLVFRAYPECPSLCLVATLLKYLQVRLIIKIFRSKDIYCNIATIQGRVQVTPLLGGLSKQWQLLIETLVNSEAENTGVNLNIILASASWSKGTNFKRLYLTILMTYTRTTILVLE